MQYDHIIRSDSALCKEHFHLACGYCTTTSFLFERAGFSAIIDCCGKFTFCSADGQTLETRNAKPMTGGRGCYMDVLITTTDTGAVFHLPEYEWTDHYPNCDGESDRWDAKIIGVHDEIVFRTK